nr:uncharacterized protein LOC115262437 [Aedes albopictus]
MDAPEARRRYADKVRICGKDPYSISTTPMDVPLNVNFAAIYNYMVVEPNPFTGAAKDSAKGMEANLWFQQGWVKQVTGKKLVNVFVVRGKVLHSFSLRERPLNPWVIIDHDGRILSAHCDCAIGLLETCSHVGATLFALDDIRQKFLDKKISVTDLPAYWNKPPANVQSNLYKKIKDISFGRKIKRIWEPVLPPTQDKIKAFIGPFFVLDVSLHLYYVKVATQK